MWWFAVWGCADVAPVGPPEDGLRRAIALARACGTVGRGGSALVSGGMAERVDDDTWRVTVGEVAPSLGGNGVDRWVDLSAGTCDGKLVDVAPVPGDTSLAVLEERAWACALSLTGGNGVDGSPLVRASARMSEIDMERFVAFYAEVTPTSIPSGLDLTFGRGCGHLPMD